MAYVRGARGPGDARGWREQAEALLPNRPSAYRLLHPPPSPPGHRPPRGQPTSTPTRTGEPRELLFLHQAPVAPPGATGDPWRLPTGAHPAHAAGSPSSWTPHSARWLTTPAAHCSSSQVRVPGRPPPSSSPWPARIARGRGPRADPRADVQPQGGRRTARPHGPAHRRRPRAARDHLPLLLLRPGPRPPGQPTCSRSPCGCSPAPNRTWPYANCSPASPTSSGSASPMCAGRTNCAPASPPAASPTRSARSSPAAANWASARTPWTPSPGASAAPTGAPPPPSSPSTSTCSTCRACSTTRNSCTARYSSRSRPDAAGAARRPLRRGLRRRVPGHRPGPGAAAARARRGRPDPRRLRRPRPVDLRVPRRRRQRHPRLPGHLPARGRPPCPGRGPHGRPAAPAPCR